MTIVAQKSKAVGKADLLFDSARRAVGPIEETKIFGLRMTGAAFDDV